MAPTARPVPGKPTGPAASCGATAAPADRARPTRPVDPVSRKLSAALAAAAEFPRRGETPGRPAPAGLDGARELGLRRPELWLVDQPGRYPDPVRVPAAAERDHGPGAPLGQRHPAGHQRVRERPAEPPVVITGAGGVAVLAAEPDEPFAGNVDRRQ